MIHALEIVKTLSARGARVRLKEGKLWIKPPPGGLTDNERASVKSNALSVVALLESFANATTYPCSGCDRFAFPVSDIRCFRCRKIQPSEAAV